MSIGLLHRCDMLSADSTRFLTKIVDWTHTTLLSQYGENLSLSPCQWSSGAPQSSNEDVCIDTKSAGLKKMNRSSNRGEATSRSAQAFQSSDHRIFEASISSAISIIDRMIDKFPAIARMSSVEMIKVSAEAVVVSG